MNVNVTELLECQAPLVLDKRIDIMSPEFPEIRQGLDEALEWHKKNVGIK